jgi:malate dehydrogenase (quinone)
MKSHPEKHGVLEFGTELITAEDGTIAGLLGASPGASTAVPAMIDLLERCFPQQFPAWHRELATMMPSLAPQQWDSEQAFAELQADDADFQPSA